MAQAKTFHTDTVPGTTKQQDRLIMDRLKLMIFFFPVAGWPKYPGSQGIRSSVCQKKICSGSHFITKLTTCKAFCLARKRYWE